MSYDIVASMESCFSLIPHESRCQEHNTLKQGRLRGGTGVNKCVFFSSASDILVRINQDTKRFVFQKCCFLHVLSAHSNKSSISSL